MRILLATATTLLAACGSPQHAPIPAPTPDPLTAPSTAVAPARPDEVQPLPRLPAVPEPAYTCEPFDLRNPACHDDPRMCTLGGADCKCPSPPVLDWPPCWATMPCPIPPDPRVHACPPPGVPVLARVIKIEGGYVTLSTGTDHGVAAGWTATLLAGDTDAALPDGDIAIVRVGPLMTVGKVHVAPDVVRANPHARLAR